jgi:tetratricopeptide (TPR) repeat protein
MDLIAEIHRLAAAAEQEDSKALAKWIRKERRIGNRQRFWWGVGIFAIGVLIALGFVSVDEYGNAALSVVFFGTVSSALLIGHRDKVQLPVPRYDELKKAWQAEPPKDFAGQEAHIEAELTLRINGRSRRRKIAMLTQEGSRALEQCDYLRASVAGRLAIELNNQKVEPVLVYLVASAGLGLWDNFNRNFEFLRQRTGLATASTNWGSAWALFLAGDWTRAEGLLFTALESQPENTTFLAMLAITQSQRNKYQSAAVHATKAADLQPHDFQLAKLATRILLDCGRLSEAVARLTLLEDHAGSDAEIAMMLVRRRLLRREFKDARVAEETLRQADPHPHRLIQLAGIFEHARQDEEAKRLYREALSMAHYPEALLALARLAANEERTFEAKEHLLSALNLERETGSKGRTAVELFQPIVSQLASLAEPRGNCKAWIVTFPKTGAPAALSDRSLLLYGQTRYAAETHLNIVLQALHPTGNAVSAAKLEWREAPADKQPARPVREGIQLVM